MNDTNDINDTNDNIETIEICDTPIKNEKFKLILFTLYTILYECLIWGMVAGAIYYLHWNEYTVIVGIIMSSSQLKPKYFGLSYN